MEVLTPTTLADALRLRAEHPEATAVAGGTDVMVELNLDRRRPPMLLDLSQVEELRRWHRDGDRVFVGAGVTFTRIARELGDLTPLAGALHSIASRALRNRMTLGGNLATASPAGDSLPMLAAYDAEVLLANAGRTRRVFWREFLLGPKRTALQPDELITGVEWRHVPGPALFAKVGTRNAMVISVAGVCVVLEPSVQQVRLALGSVAPVVIRAYEAEAFAAEAIDWDGPGTRVGADVVAEFARLGGAAVAPIDDVRGTAVYRRHAVEVLARRLLGWALADLSAPC